MKNYQIHQLIYTKLNQDDSPFNKKDFHTAFYPLDLLSATDVLVIENNIYIPNNNDFSTKQVVYFNKIKEETYLFVFDIKILENETDEFGRGGIFLCHVFMFPEELWEQLPSPNQLMELLEEHKFNSRNELLNSRFVDRQNGNMQPVKLAAEKVESMGNQIPPLRGLIDVQIYLNLIDSFRPENIGQKFMINATENEARELFNRLICYLPNDQKIFLGWDTMYDGGRMMDYNKAFVAYSNRAPKGGGGASLVQLQNNKIELAKDFKINKAQSPFVKWVAGCNSSIKYHYFIEMAYNLSNALVNKKNCDFSDNWNMDCFAEVNNELVEKLFVPKCKKEFKGKLSKELIKIISIKDKLLFYYDKLPEVAMADYLLIIIENSKISDRRLRNRIPARYIRHQPLIILIEQIWKENKFDIEKFNILTDNQKLQLNKYLLKTSIHKTAWYLELIKNDEVLLKYFLRQYPKPKRIIKRFRRVLNMNEAEIYQTGYSLQIIRKVFYFRMAHVVKKFLNIFRRKKNN